VFPSQLLERALADRWIQGGEGGIPPGNLQPASLDLRLGTEAYRLRCSFLPDRSSSVEDRLAEVAIDRFELGEGALLEINRPYLIPLVEELALPDGVRARANPKSSTGRLDVFTRVVTDGNDRFDEIPAGYRGRLYLEVVPLSFAVRVRPGLTLNQLRLIRGEPRCSDADIRAAHAASPLLFTEGEPTASADLAIADGLFLSLDLAAKHGRGGVGFKARRNSDAIDLSRVGHYRWEDFWEPVVPDRRARVVLEPKEFYLLISSESVRIPPHFAAEMTAYDPTAGELRTHYAGFFDPGFGYDDAGVRKGTRAVLEVRAHDVPFMIEHGQRVCKLTFEHMAAPPKTLYGGGIGSNYQDQSVTLGKHFRVHRGPAAQKPPRKRGTPA
jgi:dCTP deaminase